MEYVDERTLEVDAPEWLGGDRMPVEAWMLDSLIRGDDHKGLEEVGIKVVGSFPRANLK